MSYKDPSFQDRMGRAAEAKKKALDQLRSRPPLDPSGPGRTQGGQ